jgi:hypothetical protein
VTPTHPKADRFHPPVDPTGLCWQVYPGDSNAAMAAGFTAYAPMEHCVKPAGHVERGDPDHTWGRTLRGTDHA